ncbi:hypothetical protein [Microbacterium aurum]
MSGIPGSAAAAPIQNVGAYGQEIVETLVEVELLDEATGEVEVVPAFDLGLGFRTSVLKHHYGEVPRRSGVIVSITLELREVGHGEVPVGGVQLGRRCVSNRMPRCRCAGSATRCSPRAP